MTLRKTVWRDWSSLPGSMQGHCWVEGRWEALRAGCWGRAPVAQFPLHVCPKGSDQEKTEEIWFVWCLGAWCWRWRSHTRSSLPSPQEYRTGWFLNWLPPASLWKTAPQSGRLTENLSELCPSWPWVSWLYTSHTMLSLFTAWSKHQMAVFSDWTEGFVSLPPTFVFWMATSWLCPPFAWPHTLYHL